MGSDDQFEELTWARALEWWPFRPVLSADAAAARDFNERVFAWTAEGEETSEWDRSLLVVVFEKSVSADDADVRGIVAGGGAVLEHAGAAMYRGYQLHFEGKETEPVVVRGQPGHVVHRAVGASGGEVMVVHWRDLDGDGFLLWVAQPHFTVDSAVSFLNRLDSR